MIELTEKQKDVYDFIKKRTLETNRIQTLDDILPYFHISRYAIYDHYLALVRKGFAFESNGKSGLYLKCFRIVCEDRND